MKSKREKRCEDRIDEELRGRIEDFSQAMKSADHNDGKVINEDGYSYEDMVEWINAYALSFGDDPTFRAKRLELSWGGPQDYFLFFDNGDIEYHFLDWFDGAKRRLDGADYTLMREFYDEVLNFG